MLKLQYKEKLTIKYILERVTQEEIMEYYLKFPVNNETLSANSLLSPFRKDNNPTCNYYYIEDKFGKIKLKFRDWNGAFNGDVFDVAATVLKINITSSQGFMLLLHNIAKDFKIHKYANGEERKKFDLLITEYHKNISIKTFTVIPRKWNNYDKQFWYDKFGIGVDLLRLGKVIPVSELYIEGENNSSKIYKYFAKDPAYAYYGGEKNGIKLWKIYFPFRKKGERRFMTNYNFIQGLHLFQPAKVGIITKSLKDVLCYKRFGIQAIAVPSETYLMTKDEIFNIKSKVDILLTNFDYDKAGILLANKYKRVHGILPLMFTKGKYNQLDFGVKDFSEYIETYKDEKTKLLISSIINKYKKELDYIDLLNYNIFQQNEYRKN
jgi:hypothetical protein